MRDDTPPAFIPEPPNLKQYRRPKRLAPFVRLKHCVWPECLLPPDPTVRSPLCFEHGLIIQDEYRSHRAIEQAAEIEADRRDKAARRVSIPAARAAGDIYFIRLNDVIKIGWSARLHVRLRDYTVGAELLAHHPGSRADERDLHRTFRPLLVHGREWYDGSAGILLDHIAKVKAEYGEPTITLERNASAQQIGHKHWTGKR